MASKIMGFSAVNISSNKARNWCIENESAAIDKYRKDCISNHPNTALTRGEFLNDKDDVFFGGHQQML